MNVNVIIGLVIASLVAIAFGALQLWGESREADGRNACKAAYERAAAAASRETSSKQADLNSDAVKTEIDRRETNSQTDIAVREATHEIQAAPDFDARFAAYRALDQRLREQAAGDNSAAAQMYLGSIDAGGNEAARAA